jgi:phosphoglycolate phosphatase
MKTILAEWGYIAPEDRTETWQPDYRISSPLDLLKLL